MYTLYIRHHICMLNVPCFLEVFLAQKATTLILKMSKKLSYEVRVEWDGKAEFVQHSLGRYTSKNRKFSDQTWRFFKRDIEIECGSPSDMTCKRATKFGNEQSTYGIGDIINGIHWVTLLGWPCFRNRDRDPSTVQYMYPIN